MCTLQSCREYKCLQPFDSLSQNLTCTHFVPVILYGEIYSQEMTGQVCRDDLNIGITTL